MNNRPVLSVVEWLRRNQPFPTRILGINHEMRDKIKMQNEPNYRNEGNKVKAPPKEAQLNNQSSIITNQWKNEPNYITANRNSAIEIRKSLTILYAPNPKFSKKIQKKHAFCNFWTLTYLTQCTTKTYIKFYLPKAVSPQNTLQERNLPAVFLAEKYAKRTQSENYPEPKAKSQRLNTIDYRLEFTRRLCGGTIKYAKRTRFPQPNKRKCSYSKDLRTRTTMRITKNIDKIQSRP